MGEVVFSKLLVGSVAGSLSTFTGDEGEVIVGIWPLRFGSVASTLFERSRVLAGIAGESMICLLELSSAQQISNKVNPILNSSSCRREVYPRMH